ncbi:hypothetical protein J8E27_09105 [Brucella sp. 458]|uniref:hypothetical protein n=1 Tax=Brucella sp. 458 TaxID=2821140 RepID=UPI001ADECE50|nr:hypothetical protein [Brucella sp. 458]QTN98405.1 hypothetical protein J8E27_09105 [Brucella sp. 458]
MQAGIIENLFTRFDRHLSKAGYLAMGGQIVHVAVVAAPRQRNTDGEKTDVKAGKIPDALEDQASKAASKGS